MKKTILILISMFVGVGAGASTTAEDLLGVWQLTGFSIVQSRASKKDWCKGAHGSIVYLPGYMSVSINCDAVEAGSAAEALNGQLFYSGPYKVDSTRNEVTHQVKNFSHESLHKNLVRKIRMPDENTLVLIGSGPNGSQIVIEWVRVENF